MRSSSLSLIVATFFLAALAGTARAEIFTTYLTPVQEVPPTASTATGYGRVFVNPSTLAISWTVTFTGLTSSQVASHIHAPGAIGVIAPVIIDFGAVGGTAGTISGSGTITAGQLTQLRQGLGYINVHSTNNSGGEIRGQLHNARPIDNDGDGRTDYSVLRFPDIAPPGYATIDWWNMNSTEGVRVTYNWGNANTDFPAPGDYDGDGKNDIAIYRSGPTVGSQNDYWIVQSADNTAAHFAWGVNGDQTVQRDYDGDGKTDVAIYRRGATSTSVGGWYIRNSSNGTVTVEAFGLTGNGTTSADFPIPGDYDGDGKFDLAVYRFGQSPTNTWIVKQSSDGVITYRTFGNFNSDYILPGDYDGDGKYEIAAARTGSLSTSPLDWYIYQSSTGTIRGVRWGRTSDLPAQGDYDGDGRTDVAIYRPGATDLAQSGYWVLRSFDSTLAAVPWGLGQDFSVNTFDIR